MWDDRLERAIEGLVLGVILYGLLLFGGVRGTEFSVMAGLTGVTALLWLVRLWTQPGHRLLLHPVLVPLAAFVGYAAWRTGQAEVAYLAQREFWMIVVYATVFVLVLHNLQGQDALQRVSTVLVAAGAILAVYAIGQYLSQSEAVLWLRRPAQYFRRAGATFVNPNHFAALMVLLLPLALAQTFLGRTKGPIRVFHGYAAAMMAGGLAVTMSRGGWLAGTVTLLTFFAWLLIRRRQMRIPALVGLGVVVVAGTLFLTLSGKARQRVEGINQAGTADSGNRLPLWKPAIAMWRDNVLFGVGPAHYDVRFPQYRDHTIQTNPGYAHNEYLNTLADYGAVGAGILGLGVLTLAGGIVLSRKYVERGIGDLGDKGSNRTAYFVGGSIAMVGLAVHSAGDFILHIPAIGLVAATMTAQLASTARFASERWWYTPRWWSRALVTIPVVAAVVQVVPVSIRAFREGLELNRASLAANVSETLLGQLRRAAAVEPGNPRTLFELGENLRRMSFQGETKWQAQATEATDWLQKAVSANPRDPMPHVSLGLCWYWLDEPVKSKREFEIAMDLGTNNVTVANHYAWSLLQQGRVKAAQAVFEQSIEWNSWDNWFARRHLEDIARGRWKEAAPKAN